MEKELKTNARYLGPEEQYQIRKSIIRMLKQEKRNSEIALVLDVSERLVRSVKKSYAEQGIVGIKPKLRGRRAGENRILSVERERKIAGIITDKNPEQLRLPGCMWTRNNIRDLIKELFKIDIKLSTLGYYLQRWGFSVQRPMRRARKQDEKQIERWLNDEFPGISERAKAEGAEIFFGDETGVQNTANYAKGYAPVRKTPILQTEAKKMKINMLSAVSKRGKLRFVLYKDNMDAGKLIDFMRRLVKDTSKKVFLILDNLRVHHSKKATVWLARHKAEIEIFYLPPYAPEYNPGELLNSDLKRGIGNRAMPKTESALEHNIRSHMKTLQIKPEKIRSFFLAEFTKYAA